jgi:hypothetical protein
LFEVETLGIVKTRIVVRSKTLSTIPTEEPPGFQCWKCAWVPGSDRKRIAK